MVQTVANGIATYSFVTGGVAGKDAAGNLVQLFPFTTLVSPGSSYVGAVSGLTYPASTQQVAILDVPGAYAAGWFRPASQPAVNNYLSAIRRHGVPTPISLQAPLMALAYGTVTTAGASTTITVAGATWGTNQWIGYLVKDMNTGAVAQIVSNTATVLTTTQSTTTTVNDLIAIYAAGMAPPPTITTNTATQISGSHACSATVATGGAAPASAQVPYFSVTCGYPAIRNAAYPQATAANGANVTATTTPGVFSQNQIKYSFYHDGPSLSFELVFYQGLGAAQFTVKIDDQYVQPQNTFIGNVATTGGSFNYVKFTFSTQQKRRVDVNLGLVPCFCGVQIGPNDSIAPAPIRGPKAILISDSFGFTGSVNASANSLASIMADSLGWDNLWVSAIGGTGYIAAGTTVPFGARLQTDVFNFGPFDVAIYLGGHNDTPYTQAQVQAAAQACFQATAAAMPNCQQIAFGYNASTANLGTAVWGVDQGIQAAANAVGIPFISEINNITNPLVQSGNITATLASAVASGATTFTLASQPSNGVPFPTPCFVQIGTGANIQICQIVSLSSLTYTVATGTTLAAQPAGAPVVQSGESFLTGTGHIGATTGYGNADIYVQTDGVHPSDVGHVARGKWMAAQIAALGLV